MTREEKKEMLERMKDALQQGRNERWIARANAAEELYEAIDNHDYYEMDQALDKASARNMLVKGVAEIQGGRIVEIELGEVKERETEKRPSTRALKAHRENEIDGGRSI